MEISYIFENLLVGGDLKSYVDSKYTNRHPCFLEDTEASFFIYQLLSALQHLHDRNIVHRDVKPENLLLASKCDYPRLVLTDFGTASRIPVRSQTSRRTETFLVGTLEYFAP